MNFGEDPANIKDEVQVGKVYEKEIDGRIAKRLLYTPTQIHSWFVLSPVSTGMTVSFLLATPAGASIVIVDIVLYFIFWLAGAVRGK